MKAATKKMVIKPFKVAPKVSKSLVDDLWTEKLELAVEAVFSKLDVKSISKEELYRAVEDICIQKLSAKVYTLLQTKCEAKINEKVDSLQNEAFATDESLFLTKVDTIWKDYCQQINTIRNIFLYLDRSYALQNQGVKHILYMGNDLFRRRLDFCSGVSGSSIAIAAPSNTTLLLTCNMKLFLSCSDPNTGSDEDN